jgi:protein tyrosine/serine phosphatase
VVQRFLFPGTMIVLILGIIFVPAIVHYRWTHTDTRRLREVTPGRVYRSGQLTSVGFAEAVQRYGIRTVINLQNEFPDPDVEQSFLDPRTSPESEICEQLGIRFVYIEPDLVRRCQVPAERPAAIDHFLTILDDPESYPVLIHCRAGLHRTGCMVAVYRMEYEGWSPQRAIEELKANGFGVWDCTSSNDYVTQYVLSYRPGLRQHRAGRAVEPVPGGAEE